MKKIAIGFGIFVTVIVAAAVIIPFVVDVDKYRPQIEQAAAEKMNGKLKIGKLTLTLWGKIRVAIDGLEITDAQSKTVVAVKDASFQVPFSSVLAGSPALTLVMTNPEINVTKDVNGKMNVMGLMKETAPAANAATDPKADAKDQAKADAAKTSAELPSIVLKSRLGVSITDATIKYSDAKTAMKTELNKVNLRVKDLSLSRKTSIEFWADLDTKMGKDLTVKGPLKFDLTLDPKVEGSEVVGGSMEAKFSADDLDIQQGAMFHKKAGIPANVQVTAALSPKQFDLKDSKIQFHNAALSIKGTVTKDMDANITVDTKPIELKPWSELVPMLKEFELTGQLLLDASARGKSENLQYAAKIEVKDLAFKGPNLKAKPVLNTLIEIQTDRVEKLMARLTAPGTELVLNGRVVSFAKPVVTFDVTSKGMDFDQWVNFPAKAAAKEEKKTAEAGKGDAGKGGSAETAANEDLDASLEPLRTNEALRNLSVDGKMNLAFVKAQGAKLDDIKGRFTLKNLKMGFTDFSVKMFGGTTGGFFTADIAPKQPAYSMKLNVAGLDIQKAVETQFQAFKNTLIGKITFNLEASGQSFNAPIAKKKLVGKGNFKVEDAKFASLDIAKMASEGISGAIAKVGDKIPALKGKSIKVPGNREGKYKLVASSFTIQNGELNAPDFVAQAYPGSSVDLKGATKMGLIDESLDARWEIIDTYKVTGADQVNVDIAGVQIKNVLAKGENDAVIFPIKVGCKWAAPCPSYTEAPEYLAGVAGGRVAKAAGGAAKAKVQEKGKEVIQQGLKKLFGR